jgi:hypothetical protein
MSQKVAEIVGKVEKVDTAKSTNPTTLSNSRHSPGNQTYA